MRAGQQALVDVERVVPAGGGAASTTGADRLGLSRGGAGESLTRKQIPVAIIRIARFWPAGQRTGASQARSRYLDEAHALEAFGSETALPIDTSGASNASSRRRAVSAATWFGVVVASAAIGAAVFWIYQKPQPAPPAVGTLAIETTPAGAEVSIAGKPVGLTPLTVSLAPGDYDVQVVKEGARKDLKLSLAAGASISQYLDLPAPVPSAEPTGSLRIETEPTRLPVVVNGAERGLSPVTVEGLKAGDHDVLVRGQRRSFRRTVTVSPNETMSLVVSAFDTAAVAAGWLTVTSPVSMQLREEGRVIGTTDSERLMMPAGEHEIEIVNEALGYRTLRRVTVSSGKVTTTRVDLPQGSLSINALPYAEVWINGERIGDTPIANLSRPIGSYEVIFRHPQFGERRANVMVTQQRPARLGIDMRKQ